MESCAICKCLVHRDGDHALPTPKGRSHRTEHHYVAERFFGRSANRPGTQREPIFAECPWPLQRKTGVYCYECHEELLHNPVFLPEDIERFAELVARRGLTETAKGENRSALAERIELLHDVIDTGIRALLAAERGASYPTRIQNETIPGAPSLLPRPGAKECLEFLFPRATARSA